MGFLDAGEELDLARGELRLLPAGVEVGERSVHGRVARVSVTVAAQ